MQPLYMHQTNSSQYDVNRQQTRLKLADESKVCALHKHLVSRTLQHSILILKVLGIGEVLLWGPFRVTGRDSERLHRGHGGLGLTFRATVTRTTASLSQNPV
jgi:hypothetical protein